MSYMYKLLLVIAAMWVAQLAMAYLQAKRFQADLKALRMQGTCAVGMGGRRYLYQARTAIAASAGGVVALPITPMIRKAPTDNAVCEFAAPMIEGFLQGSGTQWTVDIARTVGLEFTIFERA